MWQSLRVREIAGLMDVPDRTILSQLANSGLRATNW
jgi:hypothetical protein